MNIEVDSVRNHRNNGSILTFTTREATIEQCISDDIDRDIFASDLFWAMLRMYNKDEEVGAVVNHIRTHMSDDDAQRISHALLLE